MPPRPARPTRHPSATPPRLRSPRAVLAGGLAAGLLLVALPGRAAESGATRAAAPSSDDESAVVAAAAAEAVPGTGAAGGSTRRRAPSPTDPYEGFNRGVYRFNDALDRAIARPLARGYVRFVPQPLRQVVSNFVSNLEYPTVIVNSALQGKFRDAGVGTARLLLNTTIGIGGIADPASALGLPRHDEDFGQTLGRWGVPSGPYVVLPLFGPSNFRDGPSRLVDRYTNGRRYIGAGTTEYWLYAVDVLDTRASLLPAENVLRGAFDPYALVRDAYLQRREFLVRDGDVPEDEFDDFVDEDAAALEAAGIEDAGEAGAGPDARGAAETAPEAETATEAAPPPGGDTPDGPRDGTETP